MYDKRNQERALDYKLYFISNAAGKGNCSQVYDIVRSIRASGNWTAYGIVDWDKLNKEEPALYVHGAREGYSVENFIIDPFYVIIALTHLNNAHNICEKIGLTMSDNEYVIGGKSNKQLQGIAEVLFRETELVFPSHKATENLKPVHYYNGKTILVPEWFLMHRGHDIVERMKQTFTALQQKYREEGTLQKELTRIMAKCYPFVPKSSVDVIERLGSAS